MLSKKYYIDFARILKNNRKDNDDFKKIIADLMNFFKFDNSNFKEDVFIKAVYN